MNAEANIPPWMKAWLVSRDNPYLFVTKVLNVLPHGAPNPNGDWQLEAWQDEFFRKFPTSDRHSVRSGHSVGKGFTIACLILWFVSTHKDAKGVLTAVSQDQLRDNNWPELRKLAQRLPHELRDQIQIDEERIYNKASPELAFVTRRTASKSSPEALQGLHAKHVLAIADEASGIDDIVFEIAQGSLATEGAIFCLFSNPTRRSGYFAKTHHELRGRWTCWHVNCEDVPRARGHIDDVIAAYGKSSNQYRVRVLGEFPTADDEVVIPLELVEAALGRDVIEKDVYPVLGVDVARFGDDTTALCLRQGNVILALKEWRNLDGAQVAGRIQAFVDKLPNHQKPREIVVDTIGVGASVYDMLRLPGSELGQITRGCNVAETPSVSEVDHRLRDELWFRGRAWFAERDCKIPRAFHDPADTALIEKLVAELTAPTYDFTALGKRKVESKKDMKERGVPSPNLADAFLLSLAAGVYPKRDPRYFHASEPETSWMAA